MRIAALDIGGTSIKSGIWSGGLAEEVREEPTEAKKGGEAVMAKAKKILHSYGSFDAIGISTAGQVNFADGVIRYANENIPGYTGMRIRDILEEEFKVNVAVENDVNAAAIGEGRFGAGKDAKDFLCITYGTGVGGAIVLGKEVYRGDSFSAGEFGGLLVHPDARTKDDPFSGCYEKYASTTALVERARLVDETLTDGRKIFARLREPEVKQVVDGWVDEIVWGLISLIHIFNPACVILGGGVMAQSYILEEVQQRTLKEIMPSFRQVQIRRAEMGNQAGLLGAAYLASCIPEKGKKRT